MTRSFDICSSFYRSYRPLMARKSDENCFSAVVCSFMEEEIAQREATSVIVIGKYNLSRCLSRERSIVGEKKKKN